MTAVGKRKTFAVPDDAPKEPHEREPAFSFGGDLPDARDTSKPIAYDENGRPLYAPRGISLGSL